MTRTVLKRALLAALLLCAGCSPPTASTGDEPRPKPTRGLEPRLMETVVEEAEKLPRLRSLIVARHGELIVEERFGGPPLDSPVNIKSASKTVLSALAGIAIDRGVLEGADQKVAPLLRPELPPNGDPRLLEIDVEDLLSMRAGLQRTSGPNYGAWVASPNWVRHVLAQPFVAEPGSRMIYSTGTSHLMSAVLTRAARRSTHDLAQLWLAEPLGISIPPWPRDPQGIYFGGNDMLMSPRDLLRFGELYRLGGEIDGRRIISEDWVEESWRPRGVSPWSGNGYGYGWFAKEVEGYDVRFAWGYGGQMLFVVPGLALTVVMTSDPSPHPREESHVGDLHALLDRGIIPAAISGAE